MSTDALSAAAPPDIGPVSAPVVPVAAAQTKAEDQIECAKQPLPAFLHSPPDSNNAAKTDASDSELSDLDEEPILDEELVLREPESTETHKDEPILAPTDASTGAPADTLADAPADAPADAAPVPAEPEIEHDIGEVLPDHWSGAVPIFKPTMDQFKDFNRFMDKVDSYGMKSGIIKVIPPDEWKAAQPQLDNLVKQIKVREPIKQDIMGSNGTYRQVNILHGRSYNLPQWRQLCEQSEHQPPARRGERRANADKPKPVRRPAVPKADGPSTPKKRGKGRGRGGRAKQSQKDDSERPMTPVSPKLESQDTTELPVNSIENDPGTDADDQPRPVGRMGGMRPAKPKTQSTSARRKYSRREGSAMIDEAAFKDFDYRINVSDYTPERCEELERAYWKTLTYAAPLYGADMMGTLFDDTTDSWNLNKLPNVLDVLGTKVPGVNTAYLYLGMWKATFAWHLEDVDLYSINYLHFGAPKQWYSISQADARRFEAAMKSIWPADAKACDQFLRHKAFLISPQHLQQHFGIKVNKVVSYPGEFVVTYPYGYHSGYNLGYNCAEAVNFGLERWLEMGKIAKKCECAQAQDSVWINVYEIERKLRGEETEYEETEEEEEDDDDEMSGLPSPPASHGIKFKASSRKRKRGPTEKGPKVKVKKIKLRLKSKAEPPCCLCPNSAQGIELLPTSDGRKAHRLCALHVPETYIDTVDGSEVVCNVTQIHKDRLDLKCLFCRSKRGACFQCSQKKCARAYHATCAAAAGAFVEEQDVPVFGEDGTEYKQQAFEFSCRFHRVRRDKKVDVDALEADSRIHSAAASLTTGEICQLQYLKGEIFAGMVVENRQAEQMLLIDVMPSGDRMEVEWKWLILPHATDYHLPKASANALPLPASQKAKEELNAKRHHDDKPRKNDVFAEGYTWAEFHTSDATNKEQVKIDFTKQDQVWHYLGKTSTDAKAQYTEDPAQPRHNPKGNYLDTIPKPPKPPKPAPAARPFQHSQLHRLPGGYTSPHPQIGTGMIAPSGGQHAARPYVYKPRKPIEPQYSNPGAHATKKSTPNAHFISAQHPPPYPQPPQYHPNGAYQSNGMDTARPVAPSPQHQGNINGQPMQRPPTVHATHGQASGQFHTAAPMQVGQQSRPNWQVHSSVYQKYPFFQVNHNRDSSRYRTPYAQWGGFTNGYEGDLRAHLMARQNALQRRSSMTPTAPIQPGQMHGSPSPHGAMTSTGAGTPGRSPSSQTPVSAGPHVQHNTSMSPPPVPEASPQQFHPAIRPQYGPDVQQSQHAQHAQIIQNTQHTQQPPTQAAKSTPVTAPKSSKVGLSAALNLSLQSTKSTPQMPPKQSPVPLPANFLAAMTPSPSTPASAAKLPSSEGQEAPASMPQTQTQTPKTEAQPKASPKAAVSTRPASTTPVPVPTFPGMSSPQTAIRGSTPTVARGQYPAPSLHQGRGPASLPQSSDSLAALPGQAGARTVVMQPQPISPSPTREAKTTAAPSMMKQPTQEFADFPGSESMEFVDRMMKNLRRASMHEPAE